MKAQAGVYLPWAAVSATHCCLRLMTAFPNLQHLGLYGPTLEGQEAEGPFCPEYCACIISFALPTAGGPSVPVLGLVC